MSILKIFLPVSSVEIQKITNYNFAFNYSLHNIYKDKTKTTKHDNKSTMNFELIAIYSDGNNSVVIVSKDKRTEVVGVGEVYEKYELVGTTSVLAIWTKNNIRYELSIEDTKDRQINNAYKIENEDPLVTREIDYNDIQYYKNNPQKLWNEININKTVDGYMVTKIKKNSKLSTLGLKKGDIIKVVNGKQLINDSDAIKLYKDIKNLEFMTITILRAGEYIDFEFNIKGQQKIVSQPPMIESQKDEENQPEIQNQQTKENKDKIDKKLDNTTNKKAQ
jgi:general secretion pathway protein C